MTATGLAAQGGIVARAHSQPGLVPWILTSTAMLAALIAPVLWNGFPLIFPDTGGYLERPLEGTLDLGRSAFYGLFLAAGVPSAFWLNVVVQAALTVWIVVLVLRTHGFGGRPWLAFGVVALLSLLTSLPWLAGELLPDILFPAAVLALEMLIFRGDRLAGCERLALGAVIAFAMVSHMAAAGLCAALIPALWLASWVRRLDLPQPRLRFAAAAVVAGIALCPISNGAITGTFAFTPGGSSFIFGRLVEDGIVQRYLADTCPNAAIRLCAFRDDVPDDADDWLWDPDSPYRKLGGWEALSGEERDITLATLRDYPLLHAAAAAADIFDQLTSFQTEVSLEDNAPTVEAIERWAPHLLPALMQARQQKGAIDVDALNLVDVPAATLAMLALVAALAFRRRLKLSPRLTALGATVLLALFVNASICAVLSHSVDRYQSRLTPLTVLAVMLIAAERRRTRLGLPADLS